MNAITYQKSKDFWLAQWLILNSPIPLPKPFDFPSGNTPHEIPFSRYSETLGREEIIRLAKEKIVSRTRPLISTAPYQRDLLPAFSLQAGTTRSLSVCRITRIFPHTEFEEFIAQIIQEVKRTKQGQSFDSIEALNEIFLIPEQLSRKIFSSVKDSLRQFPPKLETPTDLKISLDNSVILLGALAKITEAQLSKLNPIPIGSGFLVGVTHLLTNHHVIWDKEIARQCIVQFNYTEDSSGSTQKTSEYEIDPDALFVSEAHLDYTLVQLKSNQSTRQAGYNFGWLQLAEDEANIAPGLSPEIRDALVSEGYPPSDEDLLGDNIFIIHHPKGNQKKVDLSNNRVIENGLFRDLLRYQGDSDFGSSGSPVFNTKWELVALHHAAISTKTIQENDTSDTSNEEKEAATTFVQQGIRICRIVEDLKQKSAWNPKLRGFIDDFVITAEQLNYPPLSSALDLNGINHYAVLGENIGKQDSSKFSMEAWINPGLVSSSSRTIFSKICQEDWDVNFQERWGSGDTVFNQYIEFLSLTKNREIVFTRKPFWLISSASLLEKGTLYSRIEIGDTLQHPIDILTSKPNDFKEGQRIRALQSILYDLGTYHIGSNASTAFDPNDYQVRINGELDVETREAYKQFCRRFLTNIATAPEIESLINILQLSTVQPVLDALTSKGLSLRPIGDPEKPLDSKNKNTPPSRGFRVLELQECLKNLVFKYPKDTEFQDLAVTGVFDPTTEKAVTKLQEKNNLQKDGIFGFNVLQALELENSYEVQTRESLPPGQFSHVAVTRNLQAEEKTLPEVKIYINGQLAARRYVGTHGVGKVLDAVLGALPSRGSWTLEVIPQPKYRSFFRGVLAEVRLWQVELEQSRIAAHLYHRLTENDLNSKQLIGYWRFEEGGSDANPLLHNLATSSFFLPQCPVESPSLPLSAEPTTGNDPDIYVQPKVPDIRWLTAAHFPAVPLTFGMQFDTKTDCVDCFDGKTSAPDPVKGITVELWVKHQFGNGTLLNRTDEEQGTYALSWEDSRIKVELKSQQQITHVKTQDCVPGDQSWHHIAFSWETATRELELYVDGKRQNVLIVKGEGESFVDRNSNISFGIFRGNIRGNLTQNLMIGTREEQSNRSSLQVAFKGAIAELRLWKTARTQTEIKANLYRRLILKQGEPNPEPVENSLVAYWRLDDGETNRLKNLATEDDHAKARNPVTWIAPPKKAIAFSDIPGDHWASEFIKGLIELGLIGGFIDISTKSNRLNFVPLRPKVATKKDETEEHEPKDGDWMTKAEFAALLILAFGGKPKLDRLRAPEFYDQGIERSSYFSDLQYAYQLGLLSESKRDNQGNKADYDKPVNRQQVIDALIDSMRLSPIQDTAQHLLDDYEDLESTNLWMGKAKLATALECSIVVRRHRQNAKKLELARITTRAEIAAMVYQALVWLKQAPLIESDRILK